jgi:hypothetical protein
MYALANHKFANVTKFNSKLIRHCHCVQVSKINSSKTKRNKKNNSMLILIAADSEKSRKLRTEWILIKSAPGASAIVVNDRHPFQ